MSHLLKHPGYAYTAVQDGHIRILEVLPGRGSDPVVCLMHEASLDEHPHYEALSYVWGDPPALVFCIYVVDSPTAGVYPERFPRTNEDHAQPQEKPYFLLQITATLHCALIRLRHSEQSRRLWVDAVCINQKDLREQSTQVGMMTRIFGQAARVVAHLGPEEDESEILPSKDIEIYCGNWELEWSLFEGPARLAAESARSSGDNYGWQFQAAKGSHKLALELINSRRSQRANRLDLLELLDAFRLFPVTNRQDKIYSLLGICADRNDPAFTVDYLELAQDTFTRYSKRFVEKGYGVNVLYCAANSRQRFDGPSWVANWDDQEFPQTMLASVADSSYYSASGNSSPTMHVLPDSSNLQISGIIVDELEQLSGFSPADDHRKCRNDIYTAWKELQSLLKAENPYQGQCLHEVIWRTMICDKMGELLYGDMSAEARMLLAWDHKQMSKETQSWYSVYGDPIRTASYFPASEKIKRQHEEGFMQTAVQYAGTALNMMHWKRFAASSNGYLASVPVSSLPGDLVCVVMGATVPFVLRPLHGGYQLIGECYVHGLMCGEALKMTGLDVKTLTLV
jgi:hypothetical protein